jgi:glycosyltransferase involved in cell wall biosynthesis
MRIVFDHQVFAFQKYGGVSRYVVRLIEGLMQRPSLELQVVAPLFVNAYLAALPRSTVTGLAIPDSDFARKVARNIDQRLAPLLIARTPPSIVHETYYARRGSAPRGVPTILTVHDMIHEKFPESFAEQDPTAAIKRAAVLRADRVVCVSESTRRDLVAIIPDAEPKTSVTRLGFDSFALPGPAQEALPTDALPPYLLYVGSRAPYKNFGGLLAAFAASPQLRDNFVIRAFGGGAPTAADTAILDALKLADGAVIFEQGGDALLAQRYRGAAAFVYPSLYEGFGIPPLEAMSAGCPVVASDRSSIPEVCGDAAAYFIPDDTDSMRAAIESVVFDSSRRSQLILCGHARTKLFSWDRCVDATLDSYRLLA